MSRKEIYEFLEKAEGGEAIKAMLKTQFTEDDKKLQDSVDALNASKREATTLQSSFDELKQASEGTVPKTEMEKTIAEMQKTLDGITTERDEANKLAQDAAAEKKNGELNSHFSKAVIDAFGAKNTEMAVGFGMSNGSISYTEDGEMSYNQKTGDEAIELFRTDNAHLVQNKGTGTRGGEGAGGQDSFVKELEAQMLRD